MPTLAQIAEVIHGELDGDGSVEITHACEISSASAGGITYLADPQYGSYLADSLASAVILGAGLDSRGLPGIRVENPALGFAAALAYLYPGPQGPSGTHPTAVLGRNVQLGREVSIGPHAVIGDEVVIGPETVIGAGAQIGRGAVLGEGVRLYPNVVLYDGVQVGDGSIIHGGAVIGSDGFGFVTTDEGHTKMPQVGAIVIGNQVEIGANSTIDRGTIGNTVIGDGTKIDNLVHIAHNVKVGRGCLFAGEVGIAGSTTIGDFVTLAGQVGVVDHVTIGDRVVVASKSAVMQSVPAGQFVAGVPAGDRRQWLRQTAAAKQLPELAQRIRGLETRLAQLEPSGEREGG